MLLSLVVAGGTSANSSSVRETSSELVTYEVAPDEVVIREVAPQEVVVKEIALEEIIKRRPRKEAVRRPVVPVVAPVSRVEALSAEIPDLAAFLDRLMLAESGGRDTAANPLSTALGPFQFIKATFIDVARRHFPAELSELTDTEVLELRTHRSFARAAAAVFTLENAAYLKGQGLQPSLPHLRLAHLLGPTGASRVLQAEPQERLSEVLGASVIRANPFMVGMTASGLVAKATREVFGVPHDGGDAGAVARPEPRARPEARARPGSQPMRTKAPTGADVTGKVRCNQKLISCQRWIALQKKQQKVRDAQGSAGKPNKV